MEYYSAIKEKQAADGNVSESQNTGVGRRNQTQKLYDDVNVLHTTELSS